MNKRFFKLALFLFLAIPHLLLAGTAPKKISVIGAGNFGSSIARLIGKNVTNSFEFDHQVSLHVYENDLVSEINLSHVNNRYLKDINLGENVIASSDLGSIFLNSDIIFFVIPHQYLKGTLQKLKNLRNVSLDKKIIAVNLGKGIYVDDETGEIELMSNTIENELMIPTYAMSGANIAEEIARDLYTETTLGYNPKSNLEDKEDLEIIRKILQNKNFAVETIPTKSIELLGALKNIIALAVGFTEGSGFKENTKAAIFTKSLKEMALFLKTYDPDFKTDYIYETSAGLSDLIASSFGGRNYRCSKEYANRINSGIDITLNEIENEMLGGGSLQGIGTALDVKTVFAKNSKFHPKDYKIMSKVISIIEGEKNFNFF